MPTYDYACGACGAALEIFHSMTEAAKRKCPECGALKLVRKIGAGAGFLFKGDGFYQTDYRSKSYQDGKKADQPAAPAESTPSKEAPKEPKPEAKKKPAASPKKAKD